MNTFFFYSVVSFVEFHAPFTPRRHVNLPCSTYCFSPFYTVLSNRGNSIVAGGASATSHTRHSFSHIQQRNFTLSNHSSRCSCPLPPGASSVLFTSTWLFFSPLFRCQALTRHFGFYLIFLVSRSRIPPFLFRYLCSVCRVLLFFFFFRLRACTFSFAVTLDLFPTSYICLDCQPYNFSISSLNRASVFIYFFFRTYFLPYIPFLTPSLTVK